LLGFCLLAAGFRDGRKQLRGAAINVSRLRFCSRPQALARDRIASEKAPEADLHHTVRRMRAERNRRGSVCQLARDQ